MLNALPITNELSEDEVIELRGTIEAESPNKDFSFKVRTYSTQQFYVSNAISFLLFLQ